MSPTKDERRQMVLGVLATHGQVQWHTRGADIAFADDVLELAARMRRQADDAVPPRPARVATDAERRAAMSRYGRRSVGAAAAQMGAGATQRAKAVHGHPRVGRRAHRAMSEDLRVTDGDPERAAELADQIDDMGPAMTYRTLAAALAEERTKARAPFLALAAAIEAGHASTHTVLHDCHTLIRAAAEETA